MIRESFLKVNNTLVSAVEYSPESVKKLITLCNKVSVSHSQSDLLKMYRLCLEIVNAIPDQKYFLHIQIVYDLSSAFIELGKKHKKVLRSFDGVAFDVKNTNIKKLVQFGDPHIYAIGLYVNLAVRLEDIGLPGEAFNAILKSMDPWVQVYNRSTGEGDFSTTNNNLFDYFLIGTVLLEQDENRKLIVGRAAAYFRIIITLGMETEYDVMYSAYERFSKQGEDAAFEDIRFFTNYYELISNRKQHKQTKFDEIEFILTSQYHIEKSKNRSETSFLIAYTLAKVLNSKKWAQMALVCNPPINYWADILYMQALVACSSETLVNYDKIITNFLLNAGKIYPDRMMLELFKQKNSDLINLLLASSILKGDFKLGIELIYAWWKYKPNTCIPSTKGKTILVSLPNLLPTGGHFLLHTDNETIFISNKSKKKLFDLFLLKNKVESSWTVLLDEEETLTPNTDLRNHIELSQEYIESIADYIGLEELIKILNSLPTHTHIEYLELAWTNMPVLALISNLTNNTYAVSIRSSQNFSPREIKKALLWADPDGTLNISSFEVEALLAVFANYGIECELYAGSQCTKELFLEKYSNPEFDLIWIISHGEFNSDNPPCSLLHISQTQPITAWELQESIPANDSPRYLILNACQSGTAGVRFNSMGFLGLGPSATNDYQTVLGHLWVVDSLASAVMGTLVLNTFLESNSLPLALKRTTSIMAQGNNTIVKSLSNINPELQLIDRVQNSISKDLSSPFYSLSALVFE